MNALENAKYLWESDTIDQEAYQDVKDIIKLAKDEERERINDIIASKSTGNESIVCEILSEINK